MIGHVSVSSLSTRPMQHVQSGTAPKVDFRDAFDIPAEDPPCLC